MYLKYSFDRGNILFIDNDYHMILSCDGHDGNLIMMQLTGEHAGVTYFRRIGNIVDKIDKHYFGFSDLIKSLGDRQDEIISLSDEIGALKDELQECYEIADFKNNEIGRLQKKVLSSVNKDSFDKAVNDLLNDKEITTVEEVSALMKIRALLYK